MVYNLFNGKGLSVCYEGFITRIKKKKEVDEVIAQPNGFLMIRFSFVSEHDETLKKKM